jgi:hypothetical protein
VVIGIRVDVEQARVERLADRGDDAGVAALGDVRDGE